MLKKLTTDLHVKPLTINQQVFTFLIIIVIACDYRVFNLNFLIGWDDHWVVVNSYTEQGFSKQNLFSILFDFYRGQYAPVNQFYYTSLYELFGYNQFYFHLVGVVLHLLNSYLVYLLILKILECKVIEMNNPLQIAVLTAILFAVHPINLEATAWISASKIPLYTFFYLLALLTYFHYIERRQKIYYWLLALLFIFSFGAKEQAVTLPVCLLLLDYVMGRSLNDRKVWIEKAPFILMSVIFGLLTIASQQLGPETTIHYSYSFAEKILLAFYSLSEYLPNV